MKIDLAGKTALVTGASRGIGKSVCEKLAENGAKVIAVARSRDQLEGLLATLEDPKRHSIIALDLAKRENTKKLKLQVDKLGLSPDIVVNNLGGNLGIVDPLSNYEDYEEVMYLNLGVAIQLNKEFIPSMIGRKYGRICHISSISALENQGPPQYCAAKAALNSYIRSLGRYVSKDNVILTGVMPGAIYTEDGYWDEVIKNRPEHAGKFLKDRMAIGRFGNPAEISSLVAFLVSENSSFMVGSVVLADGGQGRTFQQ
jgi:3-oxoacyl-[acyl-carrier protein] reductase